MHAGGDVHSSREDDASRPADAEVRAALERVLASADFDASPRSRDFLRYVVEEMLAGRADGLTQTALAVEVFGRREGFDPTIDPIVRIQAGRLRRSLERYYLLSGAGDSVRLELTRGHYVPRARAASPGPATTGSASPGDDWPTVATSMVETPAGAQHAAAAVRLLDHLRLELGRYQDVRVVIPGDLAAPGALPCEGARFSLSVRVDDDGRSIVARLVDCRTARQVWAEEYRAGSVERRAFQEETARIVAARVASEQGVVARLLWAEERIQPKASPTAYSAVLASYQFFFHRVPSDLAPAIDALEAAVAVEPECSLAWVQLSRLFTANYAFEVAPLDTPIERAVEYAQRGVHLDPSSQRARVALAGALLVKGEVEAARREALSALEVNRDSLVYLEWIGWLLTMCGDWELGPTLVRRAFERNPHVIPVAHHALWLAHLQKGEMEEAYEAALQLRDPAFHLRSLMRACCLGHLGRVDEARIEAAELLTRKPDFRQRGRVVIGRHVKFPDLVDRVVDGLLRGGLALE
jgi:adenylate cyclase